MRFLGNDIIQLDCSGRTIYAFGDVIGLDALAGDELHYGYDGDIKEVFFSDHELDEAYEADDEDTRFRLMRAEKAEIALHMMRRWQALYDFYSQE